MNTTDIRKHLHELIDKMEDSQILSINTRDFREGYLAFLFNFVILFHNHIPLFVRDVVKQF